MPITVTTRPLKTRLASLAAVKADIKLTTETDQRLIELIDTASDTIRTHCNRLFGRAVYSETVRGYGTTHIMVSRLPLVALGTITLDGEAVTDVSIEDAEAGLIYRRFGWRWGAQLGWALSDYHVPHSEHPEYVVPYTAGWLLPDDDLTAVDLAVDATDDSFNVTASVMPLLVLGDQIVTSGFANAANNGTFTVVSRTATKVIVSDGAALVTEAAGAEDDPKTLAVRTLPYQVERAAVAIVKSQVFGRGRDPRVSAKSVGGLSISYAGQSAGQVALPLEALQLLSKFVQTGFGV